MSQSPSKLVPPHLRPALESAALRLFVQLLTGSRCLSPGALALGHGRALLAERGLGRLWHVGQGALLLGALLGLGDILLRGLCLLSSGHRDSFLLIDCRPLREQWSCAIRGLVPVPVDARVVA